VILFAITLWRFDRVTAALWLAAERRSVRRLRRSRGASVQQSLEFTARSFAALLDLVIAGVVLLVIALEAVLGLDEILDSDAHRGLSWSCAILGGAIGLAFLLGSPPPDRWVPHLATLAAGVSGVGLFSALLSSLLAPGSWRWRAPALANTVALCLTLAARVAVGSGSSA
jgi:hypothetical protein